MVLSTVYEATRAQNISISISIFNFNFNFQSSHWRVATIRTFRFNELNPKGLSWRPHFVQFWCGRAICRWQMMKREKRWWKGHSCATKHCGCQRKALWLPAQGIVVEIKSRFFPPFRTFRNNFKLFKTILSISLVSMGYLYFRRDWGGGCHGDLFILLLFGEEVTRHSAVFFTFPLVILSRNGLSPTITALVRYTFMAKTSLHVCYTYMYLGGGVSGFKGQVGLGWWEILWTGTRV